MFIYACIQCRNLTAKGLINKYNEHFCSEKCYKNYCKSHNYECNLEELNPVKTFISTEK